MEKSLIYLSYLVNIIVVAGWLTGLYARFHKKRIVVRLLGAHTIPVYFPLRYGNRSFGEIAAEDFHAALYLAEFLRALKLEVSYRQIRSDVPPIIEPNAVVFCGPKSSPLIARYVAADPFYRVEQRDQRDRDRWVVRDVLSTNDLVSPMDQTPRHNGDLAYVGRLQASTQGNFLLLCGIHAVGTLGAAHFLCNLRNIRRIVRETKGNRFSAVVSSQFEPSTLAILSSELLLAIRCHA